MARLHRTARAQALSERERARVAAYVAVNMPLPADGRDLAWNECQSCHSLFAGRLTQALREKF
jgi:hypothetical protein